MKLSIKFLAQNKVVHTQGKPGLDMLEDIRMNVPSVKKLSMQQVEIVCPFFHCDYDIEDISEAQANDWSTFRGRMSTVVIIPDAFLGRYLTFRAEIKYSNNFFACNFGGFLWYKIAKRMSSGNKVVIYTHIDEKEMLQDWEKAGCPLFWGITEKEWLKDVAKSLLEDHSNSIRNKFKTQDCLDLFRKFRTKAEVSGLLIRSATNELRVAPKKKELSVSADCNTPSYD